VEGTFIESYRPIPGIQIVFTFVTKTCSICGDTSDTGVTYHRHFGENYDVCSICMPGVTAAGGDMHTYTKNASPIMERQAARKAVQHELLLQVHNNVGVDHDQLIREIIMDTPLPDYDVPENMNCYKQEMRDTALYSVARVQYSNEQILKYLKHIPGVVRIATKFLRPNMDE